MDALPEELIVPILSYLWREDTKTFFNVLCSSKRLHRIGSEIIYTHVCIHYFRYNTAQCIKTTLRSLTIAGDALLVYYSRQNRSGLCQALSRLTALETSSITQTLDFGSKLVDTNCATTGICQMLLALPCTIINLEMVLENVGRPTPNGQICDAIAPLLPQVETLRLQLPALCDSLFRCLRDVPAESSSVVVSNLRHATVWASDQMTTGEGRGFFMYMSSAIRCSIGLGDWELRLSSQPFYESIQALHEQGHFPHLQHLCVAQVPNQPYFKDFPTIYEIREAVSRTVLIVRNQWTRYGRRKMVVQNSEGTAHILCSWAQYTAFVEPAVWTTLPNGSRIPRASKSTIPFEVVCRNLVPSRP